MTPKRCNLLATDTRSSLWSQVNKLTVSEAERKDQEENKQEQPLVLGTFPHNSCYVLYGKVDLLRAFCCRACSERNCLLSRNSGSPGW